MTKITNYLEDKSLTEAQGFKQVYRIYEACQKHFEEASQEKKKAKKAHWALKADTNASKESIKAAKCARREARNLKSMWRKMLKTSASHLKKWVKLHEHCGSHQGKEKSNDKATEKKAKKKATLPTPKSSIADSKVSKPQQATSIKRETQKPAKTEAEAKAASAVTKKAENPAKSPAAANAPIKLGLQKKETAKPAQKKVGTTPTTDKKAEKPPKSIPVAQSPTKDDLKKIEGIGPKIEGLLNADGIHTFSELSKTPVGRLQSILDKAGPRFMLARPASWPQQATLAANGQWDDLNKLQAELRGGK